MQHKHIEPRAALYTHEELERIVEQQSARIAAVEAERNEATRWLERVADLKCSTAVWNLTDGIRLFLQRTRAGGSDEMNCRRCDYEMDPEFCGWVSEQEVDNLRARLAAVTADRDRLRRALEDIAENGSNLLGDRNIARAAIAAPATDAGEVTP